MDVRSSSPFGFQLDSIQLKRMVKELEVIAEPSPLTIPNPPRSNVILTMPSCEEDEKDMEDSDQNEGQWLRAAVLGANDGLVTTASLMMGVGAVKTDAKTMVVSGLAALVAGACSMAIGEFISMQTQRDVELCNLKRQKRAEIALKGTNEEITVPPHAFPLVISREEKEGLPSPIQAACASALSFSVGAFLPLISTGFISDYIIRVGVLAGVSGLTLIMFGAIGAHFGRSSIVKGSMRVLIGGWLAMLVTYGLLRLFGDLRFAQALQCHGRCLITLPASATTFIRIMFELFFIFCILFGD